VLLAAAAIGTAIGTASTEKPEAEAKAPKHAAPPQTNGGTQAPLQLAADPTGQLRYDKKALNGSAGKVTIDFTNASNIGHDVTVAQGPTKVGGTKVITKSKASVAVDLKPGKYVFYCSVPGHRQGGMQGTLTIA
jgi:plastocyanin